LLDLLHDLAAETAQKAEDEQLDEQRIGKAEAVLTSSHLLCEVELSHVSHPWSGHPHDKGRNNAPAIDLVQPDAWIFDLDGTLVDTVETRIVAWLRTFEEQRIPANRVRVAGLIGSDGRRLARIVAEAAGQTLGPEREEEIDRRAGEIYSALNLDPKTLPGALELLQALDERGRLWAIATSSRREQVDASIKALRLSSPPIVIDGSNVDHAKPAPDLLLYAARELEVEPPRCCYVGDAIWDMQAAVAAGMPSIGVVTGSATADDLAAAGALFTVKDLTELIPMTQPRVP
jgi:HAD superfamily hydrolase (TIGR01509 family)